MTVDSTRQPAVEAALEKVRIVRLGWLWDDLKRRRGEFAIVIGITLVAPFVALLLPLRVQDRTEDLLQSAQVAALAGELGIILVIVFASLALTVLRRYLMARLCLGIITDLRQTLYRHIMALAPRDLQRTEGGQVTNAFTYDLNVLPASLKRLLGALLPSLVLGTVYTGALFWFSWRLAFLLILVIGPMALLTNFFARRIHTQSHAAQARQGQLLGELAETLAGPKDIKLFRLEPRLVERFGGVNREAFRTALRRDLLSELHPFSVSIIVAFAIAAVVVVSAVFLAEGWIDAGALAGFVVCLGLLYPQVQEFSQSLGQAMQLFAGRERIDRVLDLPPETDASAEGLAPENGAIDFRDVDFAHPGGGPTISGLTLHIADGERVAIVGPSGAGKSTLLELLPRFNEPSAGGIEIGGVPIRDMPLSALRSRIGLVLQTPFLFRGTLRENLTAGRDGLSEARIREVAAQARVDEFAERLPQGYDTTIEPGGTNLSVGQRQRVAIARVLLSDPPILLLDEPTSALDVGSESHVAEAIRSAARGRTTIIVAHRLTTVRDVDRIVVMDAGHVVEEGTHEALIAKGGLYASLYAQFEGSERARA